MPPRDDVEEQPGRGAIQVLGDDEGVELDLAGSASPAAYRPGLRPRALHRDDVELAVRGALIRIVADLRIGRVEDAADHGYLRESGKREGKRGGDSCERASQTRLHGGSSLGKQRPRYTQSERRRQCPERPEA